MGVGTSWSILGEGGFGVGWGGRLGASWASALGRLSNISKGGMGLEGPGEGGGLGASWYGGLGRLGGGLGEGRLEMS